ncbi:hypothetical protein ACA910_006055 [Epithemia clementina (nom. ined.)]
MSSLAKSSSSCKSIDHSRYFTNPFLETTALEQLRLGTAISSTSTEEQKPEQQRQPQYFDMALQLTQRCQETLLHTHPGSLGSLYHGALGPLVYLEWKVALACRQSEASEDSQKRLKRALSLAHAAASHHFQESTNQNRRRQRAERVTLLESPFVGAKAMEAVLFHSLNQPESANESAQTLIDWLQSKTIPSPPSSSSVPIVASLRREGVHNENNDSACVLLSSHECEVLYGRAGAIQAILFLRQELNKDQLGSSLVLELAKSILQEGLDVANHHPQHGLPLLWHWHDKFYLGAAHGLVGILQTLLSLNSLERQHLDQSFAMMSMIRQSIDQLNTRRYCFASGNLASSIKEDDTPPIQPGQSQLPTIEGTDRLVHWCHGAVGHVLLLVQAYRIFGNDDYRGTAAAVTTATTTTTTCHEYRRLAIEIANQVIWPRGLLRKGVGLCHGISGNAYALLAVAGLDENDISSDSNNFRTKAQCFVDFAVQHLADLEYVPDRPYSLYEGLGGLCLLLLDLMMVANQQDSSSARQTNGHFPLYTFKLQ